MKLICAVWVIVVHTYPFYEAFPDLGFISSNILGRIIIPFFFISSGYFLEQGIHAKGPAYLKNYLQRLIKMYLIWSLICLPVGIHLVQRFVELHGIQWIFAMIAGFFYAGTYYHLWYMAALIFAIFFCTRWLRRFTMRSLLITSFFLYAFGCLETYFGLFHQTFLADWMDAYFSSLITTRNGLFFGVPLVALGMALARGQWDQKVRHALPKALFFFLLLFLEAQTVRTFHWAKDYNMYWMSVPFTFFWFIWLLNTACPWKLNYRSLRETSTILYFAHGPFLELVPWLLGTQYQGLYELGWFRFFSVFSLTLLTTWIIKRWIPFLK